MKTNTCIAAVWLIVGILSLSSCASNDAGGVTESVDGVSLPPTGDVPAPPPADAKVDDIKPDANPESDLAGLEALDPTPAQSDIPLPPPMAEALEKVNPTEEVSKGEFEYTVKPGQTLMQVAYDVYGDIYKWKHIQEMNQDKIGNPTSLAAGTILSVDQDPKDNISNTDGTPYLIRRGDTLGLISDDVYGTTAKWKRLWDNNKKLIRDPNRIYAGFYMYYLFNEQDRVEKEQFKGLQRPAMLQPTTPPVVERDVSSAQ